MLPDHPSATTAMVFGIIGLVGILVLPDPLLLFAVRVGDGARAVKQIDAEPGRYGGRQKAMAGKVMGIIGTVVLVLGVSASRLALVGRRVAWPRAAAVEHLLRNGCVRARSRPAPAR